MSCVMDKEGGSPMADYAMQLWTWWLAHVYVCLKIPKGEMKRL